MPTPRAKKRARTIGQTGRGATAKRKATHVKVRESAADRKARARKILTGLKRLYPDADCALVHDSAVKLLVATILSAQSTDETVNKIAPKLFARYPTAADLAEADLGELEEIIHASGFFRQKSKSIKNACRMIVENHDGRVPDRLDALVELPGVARKTANVVLGTWFNRNDGVVVDTHVGRLATRMGLTWRSKSAKDAVKIEQDLMELIPQRQWTFFGHAMIRHGRRVCSARKPDCPGCKLSAHCPSAGSFE